MNHTYSYRDLLGVDYQSAFDALRLGLEEEIPLGAFAIRVAQLLALFGDGHTRVVAIERYQPTGYLPFLVADAEGGIVAFKEDRSGFIDPDFPFLISVDGQSVKDWLGIATRTVASGSDQFVRYQGLRNLRLLNANRVEAGLQLAAEVSVVLANEIGKERTTSMPVARSKPIYGPWPRSEEHGLLEGNIGYLRIPGMTDDPSFLNGLVAGMASFRDTRGLILDVRGNGGGTRHVLRTLLPYFLAPADGPRVVNIAAYRLRPDDKQSTAEGYLQNRFLFPAQSSRWSDSERRAIKTAAKQFVPDWNPDASQFSSWHYFVVAPGAEYFYDRPVVVLTDSGCFSATDIFLGAFADLASVTLMGTASGGGSGRSRGSVLAESGVLLRTSSMASFRTDGRRYDGRGIEVDVPVSSAPMDHLKNGTDSVLDAAIKHLRNGKNPPEKNDGDTKVLVSPSGGV